MASEHDKFMRLALEEANKAGTSGNRAVGAVIVREGVVMGQGGNQRESKNDPLGHAETTAMRDMVSKTESLNFTGCTLYTTLEPCPMCCGAIIINNIPFVVIGGMHTPGDRRWGDYTVHTVIELVGLGNNVESGVLADECYGLLREWDTKQGRT